jgi:hypothetical protein
LIYIFLLGYFIQGDESLLVYEYIPLGKETSVPNFVVYEYISLGKETIPERKRKKGLLLVKSHVKRNYY